jgi:thioester reductase-like protein
MSEHVLLTGATGYLGRYLVRDWLRNTDATLHLLVRAKPDDGAQERLANSLRLVLDEAELERHRARLRVWTGDVTQLRLGLESGEYAALARLVTHVVHGAAAARFDLPLDTARATNVGGVERMLDFARAASQLRRFDYIGTAYVAGQRRGLVFETEAQRAAAYRNTYEQSKFEAEQLLRTAMTSLPITVVRPSMILGDSLTGASSSYAGFTRALRAYAAGLLIVLPGDPQASLDFVPVDYVTAAMLAIWRDTASVGATFHLAAGPEATVTLAEVRDLMASAFGLSPLPIIPLTDFEALIAGNSVNHDSPQARLIRELRLYAPYLTCETQFDCSHARRVAGFGVPHPAAYFHRLADWVNRSVPAVL